MRKLILIVIVIAGLISSCANEKVMNINNKDVIVRPYGWANENAMKNDSITYQINAGNVALSIIFVETIIVPVYLTG